MTLEIPAELLPADGRFGCGPTKVRPEAMKALADQGALLLGTSHRQDPVKGLVGRLQEAIAEFLVVPDGYEVVLGIGGATAFWDIATFCLVDRRSLHYVFGEFSSKFAAAAEAAPWLEHTGRVESPPGQRPPLVSDADADVQALTHNETSTGVAMDIRRVGDEAVVLVDGTSGAGGLTLDVSQTDAYYFSLQKGFASEGGLWVAVLSEAALDRAGRLTAARHVPTILDLTIAVDNSRKRQTYNTPAIATLVLAVAQTEWLLDQGGLAWAVDDCAAKARHVYEWAEQRDFASPFVADPDARSNVVATIDLEGVDADEVNEILRRNGIVDTDGYRKLGRNQLRIGLFPAIDRADVEAYTACVDWIVERLV